jgi:hypothetical protein
LAAVRGGFGVAGSGAWERPWWMARPVGLANVRGHDGQAWLAGWAGASGSVVSVMVTGDASWAGRGGAAGAAGVP